MSVETTTLSELTPAQVQAELDTITQRLQEDNPTLDLRRGVLHDLVAYYSAALAALLRRDIDRIRQSSSLQAIEADPTLADDGVVDAVLSNWGIARGEGSTAVGHVTIVLNAANNVTIGAGTIFTANGQTFTADASFTAKTDAALINNDADRLLVQVDTNRWAFTVAVTAVDAGAAGLVKKDTLLVPAALPLGYVTSYAADDFSGGLDPEDNEALIVRLQQGVAAKAPSNRVTRAAMLRNNEAFARVVTQSVIGYGDEEMLRDKHTIFPVAYGGRVDWYVRPVEQVQLLTIRKSCTLLSIDSEGAGTWQLELTRDDAPGFYEVAYVRRTDASDTLGGFAITDDQRGLDTTGDGFIPDIATTIEGAYSRYQTAVMQFVDDVTDHSDLTEGDKADYDVTVRYVPQIADIQDFAADFDARHEGCDVLVKAAIPCFVQLSFVVSKKRTADEPDLQAIREALAKTVNNVDFVGRLFAGQLQDAIHGYLPAGMSVAAIDMHGRLRRPDGVTLFIRSEALLTVPSIEGTQVSPRTVQFYCDPTDVAVSVRNDVPVPA